MEFPELPMAATTIGPCMFGGEPSAETPVYTAYQMREYGQACIAAWNTRPEAGQEVVAWLHQVVDASDGMPDQALSFAPDSFPFSEVSSYLSVSVRALIYGDTAAPSPSEARP